MNSIHIVDLVQQIGFKTSRYGGFIAQFDLNDEEWAVISELPPKQWRGPKRKDDRRILNGIFYILRTGAPWRDLPERYGPRTTVYNRYVRWGERGVWRGIFEALAQLDLSRFNSGIF